MNHRLSAPFRVAGYLLMIFAISQLHADQFGDCVAPILTAAGLWTTPSDLARMVIALQKSEEGDLSGMIRPAMNRNPGHRVWSG
jgi:hypothetical protein